MQPKKTVLPLKTRTKISATELQRFKVPSGSQSQMATGATYGFTSLILDLCILCIVDRVPCRSLWLMVYCILKDCTLSFQVLPLKWNFSLAVLKVILWPHDVKCQLIGKDPDAGKNWGQEEKGVTENKMVGWHHWFSGYEFEQTLGNSEGQGSLGILQSMRLRRVGHDLVNE